MPKSLQISKLMAFLKENQPVDSAQLLAFYQNFDPELKESTLRWRIYELKRRNIIWSSSRGQFSLQNKKIFTTEITPKMEEITKRIMTQFPYLKVATYSSNWFSELTTHIYSSQNIVVEVEAVAIDAVFHFLKESYQNVYLKPSKEIHNNYISPQTENILITNFYVDAPMVWQNKNFYTPKLEKLLVDLLVSPPTTISKSDVQEILENANDIYNVNKSTINRYAKKRHLKQKEAKNDYSQYFHNELV
jgi:hypothetical protein